MEEKHQKVLTRTMIDFTKSLNPDDVLPFLMSKEIISSNDNEKLASFIVMQEKVIFFISLLQRKGPSAFQYFLEALQEQSIYEHLVTKLNDSLTEYETNKDELNDEWQWSPMSIHQTAVLEECSKFLKCELPFEDVCKYFMDVGFLENEDIKFMRKLPDESHQRSVILLEYIKGRGEVAYNLLLAFLNQSFPNLETKVHDAERDIQEKGERFRKLISFPLTHERIEEYSGIPSKINMFLVGRTGSGKSATGNTIIGKDVFLEVGGISSGTKTVQKESTIVNDYEINVLDTPGLYDTNTLKNDDIIHEFMKTAEDFIEGVHIFLFVCRSESRFTDEEMLTFKEIEKHLGDDMFKHCLIVLTHAKEFVKTTSFLNEIESNDKLYTIFQKVCEKAIAIENHEVLSSTEGREVQDMLLRAIFDVISCNNGQAYSDSIFETTQQELKKEESRKLLQKKIDDLTFSFLINKFPFKNSTSSAKLNDADVDMIAKDLQDEDFSLFTKAAVNNIVQIVFKDHEKFVKDLQELKTEDAKLINTIQTKVSESVKTFADDSILEYVVGNLQNMPEATMNKLKSGIKLSDHEIQQAKNDFPFQEPISIKMQQSDLIKKYQEMFFSAYNQRNQRLELVNCIEINCNEVIKDYFRMKPFEERKDITMNYISKGCIPPDLHCKCLRKISSRFKVGHWDKTIEKLLLQALQNRVTTEESILQSILQMAEKFGALVAFILLMPHSVMGTFMHDLPRSSFFSFYPVNRTSEGWVYRSFFFTKVPRAICGFFPINCDKCGGRHNRTMYMPF